MAPLSASNKRQEERAPERCGAWKLSAASGALRPLGSARSSRARASAAPRGRSPGSAQGNPATSSRARFATCFLPLTRERPALPSRQGQSGSFMEIGGFFAPGRVAPRTHSPAESSPFPACSSSLVPCSLLCPPPQTRTPGGACTKGLPTHLHYLQNRHYLLSGWGFLTARLQAPSSQERSPPALYPPASRGQNHCPKLSRSPEPLTSSGSVAEGNQVVERPSLRQRDFLLHPGRQCNESTYMWTRGQKEVQ